MRRFILLAALSTAVAMSACTPFVPVKADYSKNERLQVILDERIWTRDRLREKLKSTPEGTERAAVIEQIKALNLEMVQIKTDMGYRSKPPDPVEATSGEQPENLASATPKSIEAQFGIVIDNQGINESSPGTNGGAFLGSAIGNAAYIDHSFRPGNNYSALTQLGAGIIGAILGSQLDSPAVSQYHFRYALRLHNGEIVYRDSVQQDAFRHPAGVCLRIADLRPVLQYLCAN